MSSILTNNSAMVALQTLKSINSNLGKVQSEISTGKTVESAKDNAATWAISKVMQSDVAGFEAISDSLALGSSTVGVALNAAESITDLLTEIKGKVVNSQEANVDREKIQADIEALTNQIGSIAGAAQFNGLNLLSNSDVADTGSGTVEVLSSLDRSATGVTASDIAVGKQDLGTSQAVLGTAGGAAGPVSAAAANVAIGATVTAFTVDADLASVGSTIAISTGGGGTALTGTDRIVVGVREGDTIQSVAQNVVTALNFATESTGGSGVYSLSETTAGLIEFT
ncbi:MAG: flagellin, partial [Roseobacter sp.]